MKRRRRRSIRPTPPSGKHWRAIWLWQSRGAQAAIALANGKHVEAFSAIALGPAGDTQQASRLAVDLGKRFAQDTIVQFDYLPMIHAAIALRSGEPGKAVEALGAAAPYELGHTNSPFTFALYPI